jgi:hypothetical protein
MSEAMVSSSRNRNHVNYHTVVMVILSETHQCYHHQLEYSHRSLDRQPLRLLIDAQFPKFLQEHHLLEVPLLPALIVLLITVPVMTVKCISRSKVLLHYITTSLAEFYFSSTTRFYFYS